MKITTITCAFVAAGAVGFLGAPTALAEGPTAAAIGSPAKLVDADGNVVQSWTITGLKTSSDVIPYPVAGTLWEATATDEAVMGGVTPIVSNLNARAGDGENYRVLFGVATPQGVNPATLAQGQKTTGKVYFDVTGAAPIASSTTQAASTCWSGRDRPHRPARAGREQTSVPAPRHRRRFRRSSRMLPATPPRARPPSRVRPARRCRPRARARPSPPRAKAHPSRPPAKAHPSRPRAKARPSPPPAKAHPPRPSARARRCPPQRRASPVQPTPSPAAQPKSILTRDVW